MSRRTSKTISDISHSCGELSRSVSKLYANVPSAAITSSSSSSSTGGGDGGSGNGKKKSSSNHDLLLNDKDLTLKTGIDTVSTSSTFSRMITINGDLPVKQQVKRRGRALVDHTIEDQNTTEILTTHEFASDQYMNETTTIMSAAAYHGPVVSRPLPLPPPPPPPPPRPKPPVTTTAVVEDDVSVCETTAEVRGGAGRRRNKVGPGGNILDPDHFYNEISENSAAMDARKNRNKKLQQMTTTTSGQLKTLPNVGGKIFGQAWGIG